MTYGMSSSAQYHCRNRQSLFFFDSSCTSPQTGSGGGTYSSISLCAAGTECVDVGFAGACVANNMSQNSNAHFACVAASALCYSTPACGGRCPSASVCGLDILHAACAKQGGGGQPSPSGRDAAVSTMSPVPTFGAGSTSQLLPSPSYSTGGPPQMQGPQQFLWTCLGPSSCFAPSDERLCRAACFGEACLPQPIAVACGSPNASLVVTGAFYSGQQTGHEGWAWICPYVGPLDHPVAPHYYINLVTSLPLLGLLLGAALLRGLAAPRCRSPVF